MDDTSPNWQRSLRNFALTRIKKYSVPRWMVFLQDNLAVFLTFLLAYVLRYNFVTTDFELNAAVHHALLTVIIYAICSLIFRSYAGMIRHTTVIDIFYVLQATTVACLILIVLTFTARSLGWNESLSVPISILIIHYVLITVLLFAVRITIKSFYHLITSSYKKRQGC